MRAAIHFAVAALLLGACTSDSPGFVDSQDGRSSSNCISFGALAESPSHGTWISNVPRDSSTTEFALPHRLGPDPVIPTDVGADIEVSWRIGTTPTGMHVDRACVEVTNVNPHDVVWADLEATDGPDSGWLWLSVTNNHNTTSAIHWALEVRPGAVATVRPRAQRPLW